MRSDSVSLHRFNQILEVRFSLYVPHALPAVAWTASKHTIASAYATDAKWLSLPAPSPLTQ
jgi:hypothetical protein